ncbi:PEPxxWA-CTERM sorting domain-containing protein [Phenylobacterium sp.]|uniref:PEPxxWA-CTERM sorting domain-containing protein n=1 Tax=Phenylobacterium sp. TaxID=1871053 RepID=UPI002ED94393
MNKLALLILLAGTAVAAPAAAATFAVSIGSPVGTPSCGNASANEGAPTGRSLTCAPIGGASLLDGSAAATFGYVGGTSSAAVGSGYFGTAFGIGTQSTFTDFVTFTSDPSITSVAVAANLAFSGAMNSTGAASASVDLFYSLAGGGSLVFSGGDDSGIIRNDFSIVQGAVSGALTDALLRTHFFVVPTNTPLLMTLSLGTGAGVGGSGSPESATSQFSNSFEVPFGIDAFVLPDGVTANAGDWLVNNRRVGGPTEGIPEPATWAMMLLGFGAVGHLLRRRAQLSCARPSPAGGASPRG